jgi:hypothetical protein
MQRRKCIGNLEKSLCSLIHLGKEPVTQLKKASTQERATNLGSLVFHLQVKWTLHSL